MPAPDRVGQLQNFSNVINPTKGIVGHYSDLEVDALLANLQVSGGGTVDLSAYATTAYVDGELAKVYDKAAVDAAIAAAIAGVAAPDLTPYATVEQVEALIADPANHPATDLSDYYTKPEVDQKFVDAATGGTVDLSGYATQQELADGLADKADLTNDNQNITAGRLKLSTVGYVEFADTGRLYLQTDGKDYQLVSFHEGDGGRVEHVYATKAELKPFADLVGTAVTQETLDKYAQDLMAFINLKADKTSVYTKGEVDAAIAAIQPGQPSVTDLSGYATTEYVDSTKQEILTAATVAFQERYTKQETDGLFVKQADLVAPPNLDGYATEQYVDDSIARIPATDLSDYALKAATLERFDQAFQEIVARPTTATVQQMIAEVATGGTVDLSAYAQKEDKEQLLLAKTVTAQGYGFGESVVPPAAVTYTDTGEGYGERLVLAVGEKIEHIVYKSDLDPLNALFPRIESLESKQAPASGGNADLSPYAKLNDASQTIVASVVEASRFRFDATRSVILLQSNGQERPVYRDGGKSNALAFTSELAGLCTIADAATQIAACAKKADTYTKAEVEERLLQVPSPMKYLQWGGAFQKVPAASAKDKWTAAGLLPSIQIVKGKRYRLEMTTKFGPFNTDVKECWVGFRFNYRTLNELPCTKQPLVTMGGWGTTTVTRARAAIASTAPATTTPTRADRFRFCCIDDWTSAEDIIEYAVEFEADQDIPNANFVPEICFGGTWLTFPTEFIGLVAVFRQMD